MEDIVRASINTGPRGALRLAQGIQAVIGVGGEWLNDLSKVSICLMLQQISTEIKRFFKPIVSCNLFLDSL